MTSLEARRSPRLRRARGTGFHLFAALTFCATAHAAAFQAFRDPESGELDLSEWLLDRKGFLPVPIVVTEPAVGYGGGIAFAFFRESLRTTAERRADGPAAPPDVFGGAIAGTENGTRFAGGGGLFSFDDDRWRYRGGVGWTDARLDFYGVGGDLPGGARKIGYQLEGWMSMQQALYRVGESRNWFALRWFYLDFASRAVRENDAAVLPENELETRNSGFGPSWEFDSRDNVFTPRKGVHAGIDALFYREAIGSDRDFETWRAHLFGFFPAGERWIVGVRVDGRVASGDVPFYQLPFVDLRGIPLGRYQDERAAVLESELRFRVAGRWELVGFAGVGRAWGRRVELGDAGDQPAGGVGFRYEIARRLGLWAGVDVAWGPEESALYFQAGHAWR